VSPFDVLVPEVSDVQLGGLLTTLHADGFNPVVTPAAAPAARQQVSAGQPSATAADTAGDLPAEWRLVRELEGQSYAWPEVRDDYARYRVFAASTARGGTAHIAIGETVRPKAWGRHRKYLVAFLTSGSPQVPLVEFLEVDDYESTREVLTIIRGSDGGKKMYSPGDTLPDVYRDNFRIERYCDRVVYPRSWNKLAVIAHEDDVATMLNHALLQARRRGDL
jgi:hypothetical protein